jgi:hypothetical protein
MEYDFEPLEEMAEELVTTLKMKPELKLGYVPKKMVLSEL